MKTLLFILLLTTSLLAQQPVVLQPWMQVEGTYNGQKLGSSVGFAGKIGDSTIITASDVNGIRMYHVKTPSDTITRFFFTGVDCSLGDFNGDDIKDLLVSGNPTKIYLGISPGMFDTIPYFVKHQEPNGSGFGSFGRVGVGKINGDVYDDLVVSDVGYPNSSMQGKIYIFMGGKVEMDSIADFVFVGDTTFVYFGWDVAIGDLNDDDFDDVIVKGYDNNHPDPQQFSYIKIFLGGNQIDTVVWKYIKGTNSLLSSTASFDCNGDGIDDLLWGNIDSFSTIYIHYGSSEGIDSIPNLKLNNPGVGGLGDIIVNGGDLNGDGFNDIVIGAPGHSQDLGIILVYSGGPMMDNNYDAAAGLSVVSRFGHSIISIGDANGDGINDILVGAPLYKWSEERGKWFILLGDTNIPVTSVKEENFTQPKDFVLLQNFPNPFNPVTTIKYKLNASFFVTLEVYNLLGEKTRTLESIEKSAGEYNVEFDGSNLSSGVYYYKLTLRESRGIIQTETKQMILIK